MPYDFQGNFRIAWQLPYIVVPAFRRETYHHEYAWRRNRALYPWRKHVLHPRRRAYDFQRHFRVAWRMPYVALPAVRWPWSHIQYQREKSLRAQLATKPWLRTINRNWRGPKPRKPLTEEQRQRKRDYHRLPTVVERKHERARIQLEKENAILNALRELGWLKGYELQIPENLK